MISCKEIGMKRLSRGIIKFFLISFVLLCIPTLWTSQPEGKRSFVPEDLLRLKRLSDPQISPSGDRVAFVVAQFGENRKSDSEIWVVSTDGEMLKRVTDNPGPDLASRWSPDGERIAFLSRRDGDRNSQIYFYIFNEEKTERVTEAKSSIRNLKWSPDGDVIAFLMADPPTEEEIRRLDEGDDAVVIDRDVKHVRLWFLDVQSRKIQPMTEPDMTVWDFGWSSDGEKIAVLASPVPAAEGQEYQSRLILVDIKNRSTKILAEKTNAQATPSFSPDGKKVAFMGPILAFKERGIIKVVSVEDGHTTELLKDYPGNIWDVFWHPKEDRLLAGLAEGMRHYFISVGLDGQKEVSFEMHHSLIPYWGNYLSISQDGESVAFLSETLTSPAEIWIARTNGSEKTQLTHFNSFLEEVRLGTPAEFTWRNKEDGSRAGGIVLKPPDFEEGKSYPLVVWLHGGPAYNWALGCHVNDWAQLFAGQGYIVFLPNFRGSSGSGMGWMMANVRDWGEGPMSDAMSGVEELIKVGWVDKGKLFVGGRSYGGYLTSWIITQTDRFKAAFVGAGVVNLITEYALTDEPSFLIGYFFRSPYDDPEVYRKNSPLTYALKVKTPVLLAHGERDLRVPVSQAYEFFSALKHYGAKAELVIYPREYHGLAEYAHQLDLMNRVLRFWSLVSANDRSK